MKILLTLLAVLVMEVGNDEFSSETKPSVSSCKMKNPEKPVIVAEGSTLLNRLQS